MIGVTGKPRTVQECALEGDAAGLQLLVRAKPALLRQRDDSGREALHWAVSRGHAELAAGLLDQAGRAAVDSPDDDGWTPLIIAASAGHSELVALLLGAAARSADRPAQRMEPM